MRQSKTRAVRQRIGRLSEEPRTADELAAIKEASREFSAGKSVSLKELRRELGKPQPRRQALHNMLQALNAQVVPTY